MSNQTTCLCRVARLRNGGVEIISENCSLHGAGLPADALARALPLKTEVDKWAQYEEAAESLLTPRAIFRVIELDTPAVRSLYGGRYGRQ